MAVVSEQLVLDLEEFPPSAENFFGPGEPLDLYDDPVKNAEHFYDELVIMGRAPPVDLDAEARDE